MLKIMKMFISQERNGQKRAESEEGGEERSKGHITKGEKDEEGQERMGDRL